MACLEFDISPLISLGMSEKIQGGRYGTVGDQNATCPTGDMGHIRWPL